jgi:hypothetical protein
LADERAEFRQGFETSMRHVRHVVQIVDVQPEITPTLQALRGKLVVWQEHAESDLQND